MDKLTRTKKLLQDIGMPKPQQADLCAFVILAMAGLKPRSTFASATNNWLRIHDILIFTSSNYNRTYAENSRETFRKQALHHFRNAALIEDNGKATNSPDYRYRLTDEFLAVIREIGKSKDAFNAFTANHQKLTDIYASKKQMQKMPVRINGADFHFSAGKHNQLQKAIIEEFAPRFAPNAECLYVGDTIQKDLVKNQDKLQTLGFDITLHDKMPDVVLYCEDKNWLFFVEAVTSVGPMDAKRIAEMTLQPM